MSVLTIIFRDFVNYSKEYLAEVVQPLWLLLHSLIPKYLRSNVYSTPSYSH